MLEYAPIVRFDCLIFKIDAPLHRLDEEDRQKSFKILVYGLELYIK